MPSSKMSRPGVEEDQESSFENFDFGKTEIIHVEVSQGKYLYLKEPCADDLINISAINSN